MHEIQLKNLSKLKIDSREHDGDKLMSLTRAKEQGDQVVQKGSSFRNMFDDYNRHMNRKMKDIDLIIHGIRQEIPSQLRSNHLRSSLKSDELSGSNQSNTFI